MAEKGTAPEPSAHIVGGCTYPIRVGFRNSLDGQELKASFPCARPPHTDGHHEVRRTDGRLLLTTEAPPVSIGFTGLTHIPPREGRDPARIDGVLHLLRQVWLAYPDMRLGQLVVNAASWGSAAIIDPWHVEDDVLRERLRKIRDEEPWGNGEGNASKPE